MRTSHRRAREEFGKKARVGGNEGVGLKRQVTMAREELHPRIWLTSMELHRAAIVYSRDESTVVSNEYSHSSDPKKLKCFVRCFFWWWTKGNEIQSFSSVFLVSWRQLYTAEGERGNLMPAAKQVTISLFCCRCLQTVTVDTLKGPTFPSQLMPSAQPDNATPQPFLNNCSPCQRKPFFFFLTMQVKVEHCW